MPNVLRAQLPNQTERIPVEVNLVGKECAFFCVWSELFQQPSHCVSASFDYLLISPLAAAAAAAAEAAAAAAFSQVRACEPLNATAVLSFLK